MTTTKNEWAHEMLKRSDTIFLHIDTRDPCLAGGIVLPKSLIGKSHTILQVGCNMKVPIPDLQLTEDGMSATLSFGGKPFLCVVPWHPVKAIVCEDGRGLVFDADWQREMEAAAGPIAPAAPTHPSERPYLRRVK